jgi:hypothetical protein
VLKEPGRRRVPKQPDRLHAQQRQVGPQHQLAPRRLVPRHLMLHRQHAVAVVAPRTDTSNRSGLFGQQLEFFGSSRPVLAQQTR